MTNEKNTARATDPNDLERKILDPNIAKTEAEWWAKRRIEELEHLAEEQDSLLQEIRPLVEKAAAVRTERDALQAYNARLREELNTVYKLYPDLAEIMAPSALATTPAQSLAAITDPLNAHIERLREALDVYRNVADPADWSNRPAEAALAATPAQSLDALLDPYKTRIAQLEAENSTLSTDLSELRAKVFTSGDRRITLKDRTFTVEGDGLIFDNNFDFDACLRVSGDFAGDEKQQYTQMIADALNTVGCGD